MFWGDAFAGTCLREQVEFDIQLHDAGMQFIEGEQMYQGAVVQRFTFRECF